MLKGDQTLVWLITGTSSGFGSRLVHSALAHGDKVIATARSLDKIQDFPKTENICLLQLDVNDGPETLRRKIEEAMNCFGRIDVLVNNAAIGVKSLLEEGGSEQCRIGFQTNVFGLLDMTSAVLPYMRERRSGTIVILGSRSSWKPEIPSAGYYSASKAAVRILGETLAVELAPFSVRVLIVEPGAFRTENLWSRPFYEDNQIQDYDSMRENVKKLYEQLNGHQPGDPMKAMEALVEVVRGDGRAGGKAWPLYLPLGLEAEQAIKEKTQKMEGVLVEWKDMIRDTRLDNP